MKNLLLIVLTLMMLSCTKIIEEYPQYSLSSTTYVPDSMRDTQRIWITSVVKAASNNISAGDYERIYKTIREASNISNDLFEETVICLSVKLNEDSYRISITPDHMTNEQMAIFKRLNK